MDCRLTPILRKIHNSFFYYASNELCILLFHDCLIFQVKISWKQHFTLEQ
jgi:hypothetical protein